MYEYKTINISLEPNIEGSTPPLKANIATVANRYAREGWRTVAVMPSQGPGYADSILLERWLKSGSLDDYPHDKPLPPG